MEAQSITSNPWSNGASSTESLPENPGDGGAPLASTASTSAGPIEEFVADLLDVFGLTVDDLIVFGTLLNTAGLIIAGATFAGWL